MTEEQYFSEILSCPYEQIRSVGFDGLHMTDGTLFSFRQCSENFEKYFPSGYIEEGCIGERDSSKRTYTIYTSPHPLIFSIPEEEEFLSLESLLSCFRLRTIDISQAC